MKITNWSLEHRTSIFVLLIIFVLAGITSYVSLPVESFPQIKQPVVIVAAPYVGVSPADMETLVAQPIEKKLKEIAKIKKLSSTNTEGYTNITAEFEPDIDIDEAVRKVREKVDQAKPDLPEDLDQPIVQEINFENIPIMLVNIYGNQSLVRLKKIADDLQDKFEEIPGVLDVKITGGLEREVKINLNPNRLQYYQLGVEDVLKAVRNENLTIPGGSIKSGKLKYTVRVPGEFTNVEEVKNVVVKAKNGHPIYLSDLATVYFGYKEPENFSRLDGQPSVTLSIQKRSGENIILIADQVKKILKEESRRFPAQTHYQILADQSKDIRRMVNDLENNIIAGFLLVVGVLYLFLGTRNGLIVGIAIPLSMVISFIVIQMIGFTLNMMVLFSLILALGMLVDNAIVIVENIYRHHDEGKPLLQAAREGTQEVGMAVVASTATTLVAFMPMIFWPGIVGKFMSYLPITLVITLSASLLVALVFNPVISSSFLRLVPDHIDLPGDRILKWLTRHYETSLRWSLNHRGRTLLVAFGLYILMFVVFGAFNHGIEFFPDLEPKQAMIKVDAPVGTRLKASDQIVREIEKRIKSTTDMDHYVAEVGKTSSGRFDFGGGSNSDDSQVTIDFVDRNLRHQNSFKTLEQIKEKVQGIPGAQIDVVKPQSGPPTGAPVEIQIKGNNFSVLSKLSEKIQREIKDVPGIAELKDNYESGRPELRIRVDREKAALLGLNTSKIASTIRTAINGTKASDYRIGTDEYDITVRFDPKFRRSYSDLLNLTVFYEGNHIPLANVARVELASGLARVNHVDGDRVLTITANAVGRSSAEVLRDVKNRLANFPMPEGYTLTFAGQNVEQQKASSFLERAFFIAILLIFLVLVTEFNSITLPVVIMISVLLSFFGVLFGLLVTFKPFGIIMTGIGVISLAGVVVNNAIVLIDYIQKLRDRGLNKMEAIIQGGKTRLRPVLLTAITTILGLIPLTVGINIDFIGPFKGDFSKLIEFGAENSQWWGNMGVAVIFGLFFATALTLIIVPVLYYILSDLITVLLEKFGWHHDGTIAPAPEKA